MCMVDKHIIYHDVSLLLHITINTKYSQCMNGVCVAFDIATMIIMHIVQRRKENMSHMEYVKISNHMRESYRGSLMFKHKNIVAFNNNN